MFMSSEDRLTISLDLIQAQFLTLFLRGFSRSTDDDGITDFQRQVADSIYNAMIDAAVLEGKVDIESLPPQEDEDDD